MQLAFVQGHQLDIFDCRGPFRKGPLLGIANGSEPLLLRTERSCQNTSALSACILRELRYFVAVSNGYAEERFRTSAWKHLTKILRLSAKVQKYCACQ